MPDTRRSIGFAAAVALVAIALAWGLWEAVQAPVTLRSAPPAVMGTECELKIVVPRHRSGEGRRALASAGDALRDVEALMSVHLADSALSRFNAAGANQPVELPQELLRVLWAAKRMARASDGAFDATCRPVVRLWKDSAKSGRTPTDEQIANALRHVGTRHLALGNGAASKRVEGLELDLGGIAKGYAVDQAAELLQSCPGATGGIVNAGGDLRCFGSAPGGGPWRVGIQHPFREGLCGALSVTDAAVATSGDYRRHFEIGGRRYSHIVDPRTGRPVERTHSVTVVSMGGPGRRPSATDADGWATALSVLGPAGLERIEAEPGLEALIVTGTPARPEVHMTRLFRLLLRADIRLD